ncbi:MAG: hypothetical protein QXD48_01790 [Candidatus Aenigmatarchaeota archaeon]
MLNKSEIKVLKKIAECQLITKIELKTYMQNNGGEISDSTIDTITRNLIEKNLITKINPVGSTCFIITKKGSQVLKEMD